MIGIVTRVSARSATIKFPDGDNVLAPFSEVHTDPPVLEVGEVVECMVRRRESGERFAVDISVLTGREEEIAHARIAAETPQAARHLSNPWLLRKKR